MEHELKFLQTQIVWRASHYLTRWFRNNDIEALKAYKVIQELADDMTYELSYVYSTGRLELWEDGGNLLEYVQLEREAEL